MGSGAPAFHHQFANEVADKIATVYVNEALSAGSMDTSTTIVPAAMKRVAQACEKNGLVAGAFAGSADSIKRYSALGFRFMAAAVDVDLLRAGAEALEAQLKSV